MAGGKTPNRDGPDSGPANELIDQVRAAASGLRASDHEHDALASIISAFAQHFGRPISTATLKHGLPLEGDRLPKEYGADAALRAGLVLVATRLQPLKLEDYQLPVALYQRDGSLEVLWRLERDGRGRPVTAQVSASANIGQPVWVEASELAASATGEALTFKPQSGLDERGASAVTSAPENWFFAAFRDSRHIYAQAIAATLAINVLALAMPLFSMNIYDRVLPNAAEATLWALALGVGIAIIFDFLIRSLRAHFVDAASRRADVKLSGLIYGRLLGARNGGSVASTGVRANTLREFETLREFFNSATLTAFGDLPFMLLFIGVIYMVAGPVAFVVAAAIPVLLFVGWLTQRALHVLVLASFQEAAQKNAVAVETLVGLESIKAAGAESWAARKWEAAVAEHVRTGLKLRHTSNLGQHFVHAMQTLVQVLVVIYGFYLVSAGEMTMGALIAATILSGRALAPLAQSAMLLSRYNQVRIAYQTLNEIVAAPQERVAGASYISKTEFKGDIVFENVEYAYSKETAPALRAFNLKIVAGEHVGILGGIGSGKSTTLKLVQGLHRPTHGRVLIDGVSVEQIEPALLRENVGLILQGAELFHGSLRENITMGAPGTADRELLEAAETAGAMAWISRLPSGFDTLIRERGVGLSGGQRQSVALARALLRSPPILLLDEPTSDLDGRTEHHVIQHLQKDKVRRTLILVTHRPALLELVDRVVVLEAGRIRDDGPKSEVLERLQALHRARARDGKPDAAEASEVTRSRRVTVRPGGPVVKSKASGRKR